MNYMGSSQLKRKYIFYMMEKYKIINTSNIIYEINGVRFCPKQNQLHNHFLHNYE